MAEQLIHTLDMVRSEIKMLNHRLDALEKLAVDHESRLRAATDGVTQFKVWSGLAAGGSGLMSLVALAQALMSWGR
jgi:hypothetical protein